MYCLIAGDIIKIRGPYGFIGGARFNEEQLKIVNFIQMNQIFQVESNGEYYALKQVSSGLYLSQSIRDCRKVQLSKSRKALLVYYHQNRVSFQSQSYAKLCWQGMALRWQMNPINSNDQWQIQTLSRKTQLNYQSTNLNNLIPFTETFPQNNILNKINQHINYVTRQQSSHTPLNYVNIQQQIYNNSHPSNVNLINNFYQLFNPIQQHIQTNIPNSPQQNQTLPQLPTINPNPIFQNSSIITISFSQTKYIGGIKDQKKDIHLIQTPQLSCLFTLLTPNNSNKYYFKQNISGLFLGKNISPNTHPQLTSSKTQNQLFQIINKDDGYLIKSLQDTYLYADVNKASWAKEISNNSIWKIRVKKV